MRFNMFRALAVLTAAVLVIGLFAIPTAQADELYGRVRGVATDKTGALQSNEVAASYPSGSSGYHTVRIAVAKA